MAGCDVKVFKEIDLIEIDLWEPVPDKPGFVREVGRRSVKDVFKDLCEYLQCADVQFDDLDYFQMGFEWRSQDGKDQPWPDYHRILCFPVQGGSEGYYVHVGVVYDGQYQDIILGKTLFEGREGFDRIAAVANACARALQA